MSAPVTETAKAKVNLALHILGRRVDGYHDIDSAVAFADVGDVLTVGAVAGKGIELAVAGPFAQAVPTGPDNLICRAYAMVSQHVALPAVRVQLRKMLPVAAGIGGGSADAAAALRAFLKLAPASIPPAVIDAIALKLGADVPVCLWQSACRMEGVGERLSALPSLPSPAIVLVNPGVACDTAKVFAAIGLGRGQEHGAALDLHAPSTWRNDMTEAAIRVQPIIAHVLAALSGHAELDAVRMSGSGATCFGLASDLTVAEGVAQALRRAHPGWWVAASRIT